MRTRRSRSTARRGELALNVQHCPHRTGFTLIELIAASVLASMMMVVLMAVVWSASRDLTRIQADQTSDFPTTVMIDRIRADLRNARGMIATSQSLILHGFVARSPLNGQSDGTEGRVTYQIVTSGGRSKLVRAEGDQQKVVWVGASQWTVESLETSDPEDSLLALPEAGGLPGIPSAFRITLRDETNRVLWREVIHHHVP